MTYLVLARKYRPQTFDDVVGQQHVTQTLKNAIDGDRVAHAILFAGPRGTGKTTIARILAKAMNCQTGPTPTPCNTCRSCSDITAGRGVDVFEIDGASNNSVDQVRELRENSRYMPAHSRFKIYIIDEVHMLSAAAFNALLKTLEEPPSHVMFFLATTEPHKIPITILSRCQRHDLKRIAASAITAHMQTLCRREAVSMADDHLWAIARESDGSMRDALSLLDQVLACSAGQMDAEDLTRLLGGMDRQVLFDISAAVFAKDIAGVLATIDRVYRSGQDLKRFYANLLNHFRHLMLVKMAVRSELLSEVAPGELEVLADQAAGVSSATIDQVLTLLFKAEIGVRRALQPRLAIEMAFFKIHQITPALPIEQLIERMEALLKAPGGKALPGVVETQAVYGRSATPPPGDLSMPPAAERPGTPVQPAQPSPASPPAEAPPALPGQAGSPDESWQRITAAIAKTKPSIAAALSRTQLSCVSDREFRVQVRDNGYTMKTIKKHLPLIETVCREHGGRKVQFEFDPDRAGDQQALSQRQQADKLRNELLNHPLVIDAVDIFNGKVDTINLK